MTAALKQTPPMRLGFVKQECGTDATLEEEVLRILTLRDEMTRIDELVERGASHDDFLGTRVGAYQVVRLIGKGGMGRVYLARRADNSFQRDVAIKIIDVTRELNEEFIRRFEREREILASLTHPNIATLFDAGRTPAGRLYYVLEYIDGQPIDEYCESQGLDLPARVRLMCHVCAAVSYAHRSLVVHRDLKPGNILVDASGTPKLLDFGIAKAIHPTTKDPNPTEDARATPAYASPEQIAGAAAHTTMDVYALGVVIHQLLTGGKPNQLATGETTEVSLKFESASSALAARRVGSSPARASKIAPAELKGDLDAIIEKSLRFNPRERYGSAEELSADLQAWLDHRPVLARHASVAYRAQKFLRRNRWLVATGTAAIVAIAATIATLARLWVVAEEDRARTTRQFESVRTLADSMFSLDSTLARTNASTASRRFLVDSLGTYLAGVGLTGERQLLLDTAEAYRRLGDIEGNPNVSNLGDRPRAIERHTTAVDMLDRLRGQFPNDEQVDASLMRALVSRADVFGAMADFERAVSDYERARGLAAMLVEQHPDNPDYQLLHAGIYRPLGDIRLAQGDPAAALADFERAQAIGRDAAARFPTQGDHQRLDALTSLRIGAARGAQGAFDEARLRYETAARTLETLSATDPNRRSLQRDLAVGLAQLGNVRQTAGDTQGEQDLTRAIGMLRQLVDADPADARAKRDLMVALVQYGDAVARRGADGSLATYREARQIARGLVATGGDPQSERDVASIDARLAAGDPSLAIMKLDVFLGETGRTQPVLGETPPRAMSRVRLDAAAPPGWHRYIVLFGAQGPAEILDESALAQAKWTVPLSGPFPSQTVLLLATRRLLSREETERLGRDIGAIRGPRVVDIDSQIVWADTSQRLESVATARGEQDNTWIKAVREHVAALGDVRITGRTFALAPPSL